MSNHRHSTFPPFKCIALLCCISPLQQLSIVIHAQQICHCTACTVRVAHISVGAQIAAAGVQDALRSSLHHHQVSVTVWLLVDRELKKSGRGRCERNMKSSTYIYIYMSYIYTTTQKQSIYYVFSLYEKDVITLCCGKHTRSEFTAHCCSHNHCYIIAIMVIIENSLSAEEANTSCMDLSSACLIFVGWVEWNLADFGVPLPKGLNVTDLQFKALE